MSDLNILQTALILILAFQLNACHATYPTSCSQDYDTPDRSMPALHDDEFEIKIQIYRNLITSHFANHPNSIYFVAEDSNYRAYYAYMTERGYIPSNILLLKPDELIRDASGNIIRDNTREIIAIDAHIIDITAINEVFALGSTIAGPLNAKQYRFRIVRDRGSHWMITERVLVSQS